jgi:hypothetical protein
MMISAQCPLTACGTCSWQVLLKSKRRRMSTTSRGAPANMSMRSLVSAEASVVRRMSVRAALRVDRQVEIAAASSADDEELGL